MIGNGRQGRIRRVALVVVGASVVLFGAAALFVGIGGVSDARNARAALESGRSALFRHEAQAARSSFALAGAHSGSVVARVRSPAGWILKAVPLLRRQLYAVEAIARATELGALSGAVAADAAAAAPPRVWGLHRGRVDLDAARRAATILSHAVKLADEAESRLEAAPDSWLAPPVRSILHESSVRLESSLEQIRTARTGMAALPSLLAEDGVKRYLIAFSSLAELRGTGGFLGYFAVIEALDGTLRLAAASGRPTEAFPPLAETRVRIPDAYRQAYGRYGIDLWQNINIGIDFPTVAKAVLTAAEGSVGQLDGVIQLDPLGISALLRLTGPVRITSWPDPISAGNVSQVAQHDMYVRFDGSREMRTKLIGELIDATFSKVLASNLALGGHTSTELGGALGSGHIRVFSKHGSDQEALRRLNATGDVHRLDDATDALGVVTNNSTGSKVDWYLRRSVRYRVELDPTSRTARARLQASLRNLARPGGGSTDVAEPLGGFLPRGTNRQIILIARTADARLESVRIGRAEPSVGHGVEGELQVYQTSAVIPAASRAGLEADFSLPSALRAENEGLTYRLHILSQPVVQPDYYDIEVFVPKGWKADGQTKFVGRLEGDVVLDVHLRQTLRAKLLDIFVLAPWRTLTSLVQS